MENWLDLLLLNGYGTISESPYSLRVGPERSPNRKMPVDSNKSAQGKSTTNFKTQQDHYKSRDHDISAESEFPFEQLEEETIIIFFSTN